MCDRRTPHVIVREGGLFKYGETGIMSSVYTTLTIYTNPFWVRFVKYWQNIQFFIFPFILDVYKVLSIIKLPLKNKHKISKMLIQSKLRKGKFEFFIQLMNTRHISTFKPNQIFEPCKLMNQFKLLLGFGFQFLFTFLHLILHHFFLNLLIFCLRLFSNFFCLQFFNFFINSFLSICPTYLFIFLAFFYHLQCLHFFI